MAYSYQLLRYVTNPLANEFVNIAAIVHDVDGRVIDARFTPDFKRLRCQPLADMTFLEQFKNEFEEVHLSGEGFGDYIAMLTESLSNTIALSPATSVVTEYDLAEMDRIENCYLATAPAPGGGEGTESPGSRAAVRRIVTDSFERHHLLGVPGRVTASHAVEYGGPRFRFTFDFSYKPNGYPRYVHALGLHNDTGQAERLSAVFSKVLALQGDGVALTTVVPSEFPDDTEEYLAESGVRVCPTTQVEALALGIRDELGIA